MLQFNINNLGPGIAGGICLLHILESQVDPLLQWLDPPKRPVCYYGSTTDLVIRLQPLYLSKEKIDLIYVTTPGVPTGFLYRGREFYEEEKRIHS